MFRSNINSLAAECPECETKVTFVKKPQLNQKVICSACGENLEVAYLDPIMLDWVDNDAPIELFDTYEYEDFDDEFD